MLAVLKKKLIDGADGARLDISQLISKQKLITEIISLKYAGILLFSCLPGFWGCKLFFYIFCEKKVWYEWNKKPDSAQIDWLASS